MSLVNLYSSEVICNSSEGSTLEDFLHMCTINCREMSDKFRESSKRMVSECDDTSEWYHRYAGDNKFVLVLYFSHTYNHIAILIQNVI